MLATIEPFGRQCEAFGAQCQGIRSPTVPMIMRQSARADCLMIVGTYGCAYEFIDDKIAVASRPDVELVEDIKSGGENAVDVERDVPHYDSAKVFAEADGIAERAGYAIHGVGANLNRDSVHPWRVASRKDSPRVFSLLALFRLDFALI